MHPHPVQLEVQLPSRTARIHVLTRLALLVAVGTLGVSGLYGTAYFALPALVALVVAQKGSGSYRTECAPKAVPVLRWFAAAYGFMWMLTDVLPTSQGHPVDLRIDVSGQPTVGTALLRLITSLPALLVLALLSAVAGLLWIVGAVVVVFRERMPAAIFRFLAATLRYQFRLVAYHLSLVDRYPSLA
ncbi:MAG TPA: DUF4389 domain-containing protein [Polyangia bacterium]|nr:DUF4389 domain-containing protein [Polyangia bacterium]